MLECAADLQGSNPKRRAGARAATAARALDFRIDVLNLDESARCRGLALLHELSG